MTHLRKIKLEEHQRPNYSDGTTRRDPHMMEEIARYFGKSPDELSVEHVARGKF